MAKSCTTIDAYISTFPKDTQIILEQVRQAARNAIPDSGETISYGLPTITLQGRDLVSFAAWKHHIGLYPLPYMDAVLAQECEPYRTAKSTGRFPLGQPIPYDLIARLVARLATQRLGRSD